MRLWAIFIAMMYITVKTNMTSIIGTLSYPKLYLLWKFSLDPADVLLEDLPVPDLLLHVPRLLGVPPEHEEPRRKSVQAMNGAQVLQVVLLGQDEDHGIVTISPARMYL